MEGSLGVLEFCSALNGDDPHQVYNILVKFVKTVRRERYEAFAQDTDKNNSIQQYDDELSLSGNEDEDDEDDFMSPPPAKRNKVETWKLDTKSYNVPFVGTSTNKGSTGKVEKGMWPTGFLITFLNQSPAAMELLGKDKNGQSAFMPPHGLFHSSLLRGNDKAGKIQSRKLQDIFIQCLGEVVSCAIPRAKVERSIHKSEAKSLTKSSDVNGTEEVKIGYQNIVSIVMKGYIEDLFDLLNNEVNNASSGRLLVSVLTTLRYLASTSVGTAREVVRGFDTHLKEGVLNRLASYSGGKMSRKQQTESGSAKREEEMKIEKMASNVQTAVLKLAIVLLEYNDVTILSNITSPGVKESKTQTGILYRGIRSALSRVHKISSGRKSIDEYEEAHHLAVCRILCLVQAMMNQKVNTNPENTEQSRQIRSALSIRALVGFVQGEVLDHVVKIYCLPTYTEEKQGFVSQVRRECKEMVEFLIADDKCSPILIQLRLEREKKKNASASSLMNQVNKAIQHLLVSRSDMETRQFVSSCFNKTPSLYPHWMRTVSVPEPKASFSFLSTLALISFMLKHGPEAKSLDDALLDGYDKKKALDYLVATIVPKALSKNILTKTIHSSNAFMVNETLKLIIVIIRRFQDHTRGYNGKDEEIDSLEETLSSRLPDIMVLLSLRARFDPFDKDSDQRVMNRSKSFILFNFCEVLQLYSVVFPRTFKVVQFDWIKLLSDSTADFFSVPVILQQSSLLTMSKIYDCYEGVAVYSNSMLSPKGCCSFIAIMLRTSSSTVYARSRDLAIKVASHIVAAASRRSDEQASYIEEEVSLWIDGLIDECVPLFGKLLEAVTKVTVQHSIIASNAWNKYFPSTEMGVINFTPLISLTLIGIASGEVIPDGFFNLFIKVTSKVLLTHPNPKVLAALVAHISESCQENRLVSFKRLVKISTALVRNDREAFTSAAYQLSQSSFGEEHFHTQMAMIANSTNTKNAAAKFLIANAELTNDESYALCVIRQCFQHLTQTSHVDTFDNSGTEEIITSLLPFVLQSSKTSIHSNEITKHYPSKTTPVWLMTILTRSSKSEGEVNSSAIGLRVATDMKRELTCVENSSLGDTPRYLLLISFAISHFLSQEDLTSVTGSVIHFCQDSLSKIQFRPICTLLNSYIEQLSQIHKSVQTPAYSKLNVYEAFSLWTTLSKNNKIYTEMGTLRTDLILGLESILSAFISDSNPYGLQSSIIMKCIENMSVETFVQLSIENYFVHSAGKHEDKKEQLLMSALSYDVSFFAPRVMKVIPKIDDIGSANQMNEIIAKVIRECNSQYQLELSETNWFIDAVVIATEGLCSMLSSMARGDEQSSSFLHLISAVETVVGRRALQKMIGDRVFINLSNWLNWAKKNKKLPGLERVEESVLHFLFIVSTTNKCQEDNTDRSLQTKGFASARESALLYVVKVLPKTLKASNRSRRSRAMLETAFELLQALDISDIKCLKEIVVVCLKFGIGTVEEEVSTLCLQIVRYILTSIHVGDHEYTEIFTPGQIHSMTLSHSNFDHLAGKSKNRARKELLSLLITTTSLGNLDEVAIPKFKMSRLLTGFHASMSDDDRLLRRLLYLHEAKKSNGDFQFMHEMFWGNLQSEKRNEYRIFGTDYGQHWEWFIEGLDMQRIYKTLSNFPALDTAEPAPLVEIESWVAKENAEGDIQDELSSTSSSEDESMDASSSDEEDTAKMNKGRGERADVMDQYSTQEEDNRYSPGFLMPFILAVLEAFAEMAESSEDLTKKIDDDNVEPQNKEEELNSSQESGINLYKETYAKIAYRLFQKGAVALSIMCLSSKCPDLRKLAVSVIYLIIKALKTKEAQSITAWRSRPQIEMIMTSLQRGILVSRARKISGETYNEKERLFIPMFPTVSALFLARSLFTLSKPTDDMYGAINKFYLRLDSHHGAYSDCFSLPVFMSLFCSVNDNPDQARRERLWALKLLKDGTVDGYCYKAAARRHAPELLLSSVDAICSKKDPTGDEGECVLLLETIQVLIQRGGSSSFHHYFNAVGLLSWIQGTLQNVVQNLGNKAPAIGISYLKLIKVVLKKLSEEQECDDKLSIPHLDAINIARGVNDLWVLVTDKAVHDEEPYQKTKKSLFVVPTVCDIYSLLYELGTSRDAGEDAFPSMMPAVHPCGIPIKSCLNLIHFSENDSSFDRGKLIGSLCYLPMSIDFEQDAQDLDTFCQKALGCILSLENAPSSDGRDDQYLCDQQISSSVLQRISSLHLVLNQKIDSESKKSHRHQSSFVHQLLGCKRNLRRSQEWLKCFQVLVDLYSDCVTNEDDASFDDENDYALLLKNVVEKYK